MFVRSLQTRREWNGVMQLIDWQSFVAGMQLVVTWEMLLLSVLGVFIGVILGLIPGLSATVGIALMLPMSYTMDLLSVLVLMLGIYTGGLYGGGVSATLINTPGTAGAAFTAIEGYPLNRQGKGLRALLLGLISSFTGGLISIVLLLVSLDWISKVVLKFGSPELFMVAFFSLALIATLRTDGLGKTFLAGSAGIILGNIGVTTTGYAAGTFGQVYLLDGIPLVPALIGLFAFPEIFSLIGKKFIAPDVDIRKLMRQNLLREIGSAFRAVMMKPILVIPSALIGWFIGVVPAAGASVASALAYGEAKRSSKQPEKFGKGSEEGLIAAETANNATEGGSLVTLFCLGIPGSAATAMMLAALTLQGVNAGPRMLRDYRDMIYGIVGIEAIQMFLLLLIGMVVVYFCFRLVAVPANIIGPCLAVVCIVGAFAERFTLFDVYVMLIMGILGYLLKKFDYPVIAVVMGLFLGEMLNTELIRVAQIYAYDFTVFFKRPISLALIILTVLAVFRAIYKDRKLRKAGR